MKHINIKADLPGAGKSHILANLYFRNPFKRKYYITPQNKQAADVNEKLKDLGCINQKVATYAHFVGNWQVIKVEDQTFYIMTDKPSKRAPTKKQIDLFVDEYSSLSKKQIDLLVKHFNIRNLITAGDANQFSPIPCHNIIYENGTRSKIVAEYHDDGSLPDLPIDRQYVLTESVRAGLDQNLMQFLENIKEAKAEHIFATIAEHVYDETRQGDDLHIAYTNNFVNKINSEYKSLFENKQYITKENDKEFGLLKGTLINQQQKEDYLELKRNAFQYMLEQGENIDADEELESWSNRMFGFAYAVTSHKLQGATIEDRRIIIHLGDILGFILAVDNDKSIINKAAEKAKRIDVFHKFLYVAVSRATSLDQICFAQDIDEDSDKIVFPINSLLSILRETKSFADNNIQNAIKTTSKTFNYDECLAEFDTADLGFYNREIAADAISMSYKQFAAKHQLSRPTWNKLRAKCINKCTVSNTPAIPNVNSHINEANNVSRNVAYKETLRDTYLMAEAISSNEINSNMHTSFALAAAKQPANSFSCLSPSINGV